MNREQIVDIIVNQKRTYIDDESYRGFQRESVDMMLRKDNTSDTLVTGMLRLLDNMDEYGKKMITVGELTEILREIDTYRKEKQVARLGKKEFD